MTSVIREWRTLNRDEASKALADAFPAATVHDVPRHGNKLLFDIKTIEIGEILLTRCQSAGLRFLATNDKSFHFVVTLRGSTAIRDAATEVVSKPYRFGHCIPPEVAFDLDAGPPSAALGINVPNEILCKSASEYFGRTCVAPRTLIPANLQTPIGEALSRNMLASFIEMERLEGLKLSQLASTSFSELLLKLLCVAAFGNDDKELATLAVGRRAVENARLFIDAFASDAIRISDVARSVGVSVRSLEIGFHKAVGCSPMQYLLTRRLELARNRLMAPAPQETVTTIASDCGFMNLGLFARRYRDRYGELPSETLRRSRPRIQL